MLKLEKCKERQVRLLTHMEMLHFDAAILCNPKIVYYFTGALVDPARPHAFVITAANKTLVTTNAQPSQCAADQLSVYTGYTLDREFSIRTMAAEAVNCIRAFLPQSVTRIGSDLEFTPAVIRDALADRAFANLTPTLDEMRRRKDSDEIECMRRTIAITEAGYAAIKQRLEPGITEYQAFNIMSEAMVSEAQTSVGLVGDFACGVRAMKEGGPPTKRKVAPGDLYILDIFPNYDGYSCDLCRTFAAGQPTQLQQDAWVHIMQGHALATKILCPGARAREVYQELLVHLETFTPAKGSFKHHAGHGLGMNAWEFPWLTPGSDHIIQEGDVVAYEPGLYSEQLQGGIRLEHNYLITNEGPVALDTFPMNLQ